MANAWNAGTAHVTIAPDTRDFAKKLKAELSKVRAELTVNVKLDTSTIGAQLKAAVENAEKASSATVKVGADTSEVTAKIEGISGKDVTVNVDADTAAATTKVEAIHGKTVTVNADADTGKASEKLSVVSRNRKTTVNADADTGKAATQLAFLARSRKATINVALNTRTAMRELAAMQSLMGGMFGGAMLQRLTMTTMGMGTLASAAIGVVGPLSSLGATAISAANALWVLPGAAGAAVAGLASLMTGLSGIGKAFAAMGKSAAGGGAAAGKTMEDLQDQVDQAKRGVDRAYRDIRDSERNLQQAQKDAKKAQTELNTARKEATRDLADMNEKLRDAALDEEGAVLAVARAKADLQKTMKDKDSTALDVAEADLAYRKAVDTLKDMRKENDQLAESVAEANRKGIEGSDQVVSAKERVEETSWSEMKAYEQLEDANQGLVDAQKQLAKAMKGVDDMASGASGSIDPFAAALAKLSPNAREFVLAIKALGPAWNDLKMAAQDALFEDLGASITTLANAQLPQLKDGFVGINTEINRGLKDTFATFSTEHAQQEFQTFFTNTRGLFAGFADAAAPMSELWIKVSTAASTYFPQLGQSIADTITKWNEGSTKEGFEKKIQTGIDAWHRLEAAFSRGWSIISGIFSAAAASGGGFANNIAIAAKAMDDWVNSVEGQTALQSFFTSTTNTLGNIIPVITAVGDAFGTGLAPFIEKLTAGASGGVATMFERIGQALINLQPAAQPLGQAIGALASSFGWLLEKLSPVVSALVQFFAPIIQQLAPIIMPLVSVFGLLIGPLATMSGWFLTIGTRIGAVMNAAKLLWAVLAANPVMIVIGVIVLLVTQIISAYNHNEKFRQKVDEIGQLLKGFFMAALDKARQGMQWLTDKVHEARDAWNRFSEKATETAINVKNRVDEFMSKINELPGKIGNAFVDAGNWLVDSGRSIINGLFNGINEKWEALKGKLSDIGSWIADHIPFINKNASGSYSANAKGSYTANANGSIKQFAVGGEDHNPMFVEGGDVRIFGEKETQGEAYIPLANDSRRPRAEAILAATAGHFGLQLMDPKTGGPVEPDYQGSLRPKELSKPKFFAQGGITSRELDSFAQGLEGQPYVWGGVQWGDCSGAMSAISRYAVGMDPFGGRFSTASEEDALLGMGFNLGKGSDGDLRIGWVNGGPGGGHTAGTLPSGVNVEMGGNRGNGQYGGQAAGADDPYFTNQAYLPASYFRQIVIPEPGSLSPMSDIDDPSLSNSISAGAYSGEDLQALRNSAAGDPSTYDGTSTGDDPSSWSDVAGNFAKDFVSGQVQDALNVFGISDDLPPGLKAFMQYSRALEKLKSSDMADKEAALETVSDTASAAISANPGIGTTRVVGSDLDGALPSLSDAEPYIAPQYNGDFSHEYDPTAGAEQWSGVATMALNKMGFDGQGPELNATIQQIDIESSGNPNASNGWDSNAAAGNPSIGLLQVIQTTFDAMRGEYSAEFDGTVNDIRDPLSNVMAGIGWAKYKYGGPLSIWPTRAGYANGGDVWGVGGPKDDLIPAVLSNGEHVIPAEVAGMARPLFNMLDTNPQFARDLNDAVMAPNSGLSSNETAPVAIHYHIETNNLDEGMRRAQQQAAREVRGLIGAV